MNPPTFYGSKVEEDPQEFIDEVYKILLAMGLSISEKADWPLINSRTWVKHGSSNGEIIGH